MTARTILVYLPTVEEADRILPAAVALADRMKAHLLGLHVIESLMVYPAATMYAAVPDTEAFANAQRERADAVKAVFAKKTDGEAFVAEWRAVESRGGGAARAVAAQARAVDLVIAPQARDEGVFGSDGTEVVADIVRESGRPVLMIPYAGRFDTIGARPLVGWSATREAARAIHDAYDLMADDADATVLTVGERGPADDSARDLAAALNRRGYKAEVVHRDATGISIGDVLLNEASERGSDLIVLGAFGHSRVYDLVIGAVTNKLMKSMTAPTLFSC